MLPTQLSWLRHKRRCVWIRSSMGYAVAMSDKSLNIVYGSKMYSTADNGKEPNEWKGVHYANVGCSEGFVEQFSGEVLELIDASSIFEPKRQELKGTNFTILF